MSFYLILQEIMNEQNLSISDVARLCGLSDSTVRSAIVRQQSKVELSNAIRYSRGLGVSLERLNGDESSATAHNFTSEDIECIKKYRVLDEHGKDLVNYILMKEFERCSAHSEQNDPKCRIIKLSIQPASAGSGVWLDDNDFDNLEIPDIPEYRKADFAVRVAGDSMEPTYSDGDIVLVSKQSDINIGDIGLFSLNGQGYIKELGHTALISHNKKYDDLQLNDSIKSYGKVIGKL